MMSSEVGTKKRRKGLKEGIRGICIRFGEGGLRDIFRNKMFCFVVWKWCREEGRGGGGGWAGTEASVFLSQAVWLCSPWWRVFGLLSHLY